jgi:hypothetical protein
MILWILVAAGVAAIAWSLSGGFVNARPRDLVRALKLFAASFVTMAAMGTLALGRLGPVIALVGAVVLTVTRFKAERRAPDPMEPSAGAAGRSNVETAWLAMSLDRSSGEIEGRVRNGRFKGRDLASLDLEDLLLLPAEIAAAEPSSLALIDTWLDRCAPGWRHAGQGRQRAHADPAPDDDAAAFATLGLKPGASPAEIEAAYRRMMHKVHPDKGGSDHLASLVNAARDRLLKRR